MSVFTFLAHLSHLWPIAIGLLADFMFDFYIQNFKKEIAASTCSTKTRRTIGKCLNKKCLPSWCKLYSDTYIEEIIKLVVIFKKKPI